MVPDFKIVSATKTDVQTILTLIKELADYEHLSDKISATEKNLEASLFNDQKKSLVEALIGYLSGKPVSIAVYFYTFSTFNGKYGIYIEDLYVRPAAQGMGIGRAMLAYIAKKAEEHDCCCIDWCVMDWNKNAVNFYERMGSRPRAGWTMYRLERNAFPHYKGNE